MTKPDDSQAATKLLLDNRYKTASGNLHMLSGIQLAEGKMLNEYLMTLAKDYADKKIAESDLYSKVKEQITRFMGKDDKSVAAVN